MVVEGCDDADCGTVALQNDRLAWFGTIQGLTYLAGQSVMRTVSSTTDRDELCINALKKVFADEELYDRVYRIVNCCGFSCYRNHRPKTAASASILLRIMDKVLDDKISKDAHAKMEYVRRHVALLVESIEKCLSDVESARTYRETHGIACEPDFDFEKNERKTHHNCVSCCICFLAIRRRTHFVRWAYHISL